MRIQSACCNTVLVLQHSPNSLQVSTGTGRALCRGSIKQSRGSCTNLQDCASLTLSFQLSCCSSSCPCCSSVMMSRGVGGLYGARRRLGCSSLHSSGDSMWGTRWWRWTPGVSAQQTTCARQMYDGGMMLLADKLELALLLALCNTSTAQHVARLLASWGCM